MSEINHRELARGLVLRATKDYKQRFMLEEDLLNGEDRRRVLEEIEKIEADIKSDRANELQARLHYLHSLEDCYEEFEM